MSNCLETNNSRRNFFRNSALAAAGLVCFQQSCSHARVPDEGINIIGPRDGYDLHTGTFVSMLTWMRNSVIRAVGGLDTRELDYLHDPGSNTIGALLLHLAATEAYYQVNTFENRGFNKSEYRKWGTAQQLGDKGRKQIKGNDLDHYLTILEEVRAKTLTEFKKRGDKWLFKVDPSFFGGQPTNNYCKWFHVCEHEANHRGQIAWLRKRLP